MSHNRPAVLSPLFVPLADSPGTGNARLQAFAKDGLCVVRDLLLNAPVHIIERHHCNSIVNVDADTSVIVPVTILKHIEAPTQFYRGTRQRTRSRIPVRVLVQDAETQFHLVFFNTWGDYWRNQLPIGDRRIIAGTLVAFKGKKQIVHPDYSVPLALAHTIPRFERIYRSAKGIHRKHMQKTILWGLEQTPDLPEWVDPALKAKRAWPNWRAAIACVHQTDTAKQHVYQQAIERLVYDELLAHQLTLALARKTRRNVRGLANTGGQDLYKKALLYLPYRLTGAQTRALAEIIQDLQSPHRMHRLLQGDVGSGKTIVAFLALLAAIGSGGQGALMAPTELLAQQHHRTLLPLADKLGIHIGLLTGRQSSSVQKSVLTGLLQTAHGTDILIGTHAVFQNQVQFRDLRLVIIDEQHRFGVEQRLQLAAKGAHVDRLVMTATPIPRSLALVQYGDMEVSVLDEKPPNRQPITTVVIGLDRLDAVIQRLHGALNNQEQAYWVCPLVEATETSERTASAVRYRALVDHFGADRVGLVHGQMPTAERDKTMAAFQRGDIQILVATTVIEVGVDVANATIMIIEHAENFGLAQLHQLRGRVGRGKRQSKCVLLYHPPLSDIARQRLYAVRNSEDGFHIAETDLALRGAGDLIGTTQSGMPRFRLADLTRDGGLLRIAHRDAQALLHTDADLHSPRGQAARLLLWLLDQDKAIKLLAVG